MYFEKKCDLDELLVRNFLIHRVPLEYLTRYIL